MVRRWVTLAGRRVLDVGCGVGMYTAAFLRETPHVFGVEICGVGMYTAAFLRETPHVFGVEIERERALEARGQVPGVVQAPGEHLPFPNAVFDLVFDLVFSHEVLEHVADDRACVIEMVRVTRPGGRIVIFVPNRLYPFETHGVFWRGRYHFGASPSASSITRRSFPVTITSSPAPLPWAGPCAPSLTLSSAPRFAFSASHICWWWSGSDAPSTKRSIATAAPSSASGGAIQSATALAAGLPSPIATPTPAQAIIAASLP